MRPILANPQKAIEWAKVELSKIAPLFQPSQIELADDTSQVELVQELAEKPKVEDRTPPAQVAPQQPRRAAPVNRSQQQRPPVSRPLVSSPTQDVDPIKRPVTGNSVTNMTELGANMAELEKYFPEGRVFFFCEATTNEIVRQVNEKRVAHGRDPL